MQKIQNHDTADQSEETYAKDCQNDATKLINLFSVTLQFEKIDSTNFQNTRNKQPNK